MPYSQTAHAYVKAIYDLQQHTSIVTNQQLAVHFSVSPPAVTDMLRKLECQGLVVYVCRKGVSLTAAGEAIALRFLNIQHLLKQYFIEALGMSDDEASTEAAGIEHAVSQRLEAAIIRFLSE